MHFEVLNYIIILFALVLVIAVVFRFLRLPVVLGYLVVGALLGPHAFGLIKNVTAMEYVASVGLIFLMFTVGLEFSLSKLIALRHAAFVLGALQVIITIILILIFATGIGGMSWHAALVIGGVVAMSSTAIVVKQLSERLELNSTHGFNAVGILLFQDLAVIPLLIIIKNPTNHHLGQAIGLALLKGGIAIAVIMVIGRWLIQPIFRLTASTRVIELFTLLVLLVALASSWLSNALGMSYHLGAFLAGIMLAETKYRNQIEIEIRPFRDILMGIFFVSMGMLLNISTWSQVWGWVLLLLFVMVLGKSLLITLLGKIFGDDLATSARCGIVLAQGGEFGFALLGVSYKMQLISLQIAQILLWLLILSIAVAPSLIDYNRQIVGWVLPRALFSSQKKRRMQVENKTSDLRNHVILCGYGRIGQNISHMLHQEKIPHFALDLDPKLIQSASLAGENIGYGDSTHPVILKAAGIHYASALVICFNDMHAASRIIQNVRSTNQKIPIIVRCKDDFELSKLRSLGATQVIAESQEESLMMTFQLLLALQIPSQDAANFIKDIRQKHSDLLEEIFLGSIPKDEEELTFATTRQLRPIIIPKQAATIGHHLSEFILHTRDVRVIALRRGKAYHEHPAGNTKIRANDILVLYGTTEKLDDAEEYLLKG